MLGRHKNTNGAKNKKIGYVCEGNCRRMFPNHMIIQPYLIAKQYKAGYEWCENCHWFYPYDKNTNSKMRRHICTGKCRRNLARDLNHVFQGRQKYKSGFKYCKSCKWFFKYKNNTLQTENRLPEPKDDDERIIIDVLKQDMLRTDYNGYCPCCSCRLRTKSASKYKKKEIVSYA